jgi:hypothetical protein
MCSNGKCNVIRYKRQNSLVIADNDKLIYKNIETWQSWGNKMWEDGKASS